MSDKMNFGPEWLRNLSSEGESSGPKYQLAEHRYGREEMLALFDKTIKSPENLSRFADLFVEKIQTPVAMLPMTEEETKLWNRGISTDMVLRSGGKAPPPGLPGTSLRGRGGSSIDRGRGRGKSFFYPRAPYDEGEPGKEQPGVFLRSSRSFDRTQVSDRGWSERNGGDASDWNGSTSPRKEYGGLGRVTQDHNWRRHKGGGIHGPEEEDGWRQREKWQRSSWRDENADAEKPPPGQGGRSANWGRGWVDEGTRNRGDSEYESKMPEWANADHHEPSGSFDASGAFHGGSDEEDAAPKGHVDGGGSSKNVENIPAEPAPLPPKEKTASSAALSDAQSLDRIRAQHQNFVTKTETKETPPPMLPTVLERKEKNEERPKASVKPLVADISKKEPTRQGSEDDMSRLAVDSVVRLIEEDARPFTARDVWFYLDPSNTVQGPFSSSDMLQWYTIGFFQESLRVRRDVEMNFTPLGQLMLPNNRPPFFPLPIPAADNFPFLLGQVQQNSVKLPDREHWQALPAADREAIMRQKLTMSQLSTSDVWNKFSPQLPQANVPQQNVMDQTLTDPVRTLLMMSAQAQGQSQTTQHVSHNQVHPMSHNLQNLQNSVLPGVGPTDLQQQEEALNILMKQEHAKAQRRAMDTLWSGPGRPAWTNGLENVPSRASAIPLWEEEIYLEQQKKMHQRLLEEQRKVTEELKKKEDEDRLDRERIELERREEDRRRKEEESLRAMLRLPVKDPHVHEPQNSDLGAALPDWKREEENRKRMEEHRRKLEDMKRSEDAQRKKEEKDRKREEERAKKRLVEEEKLRLETEKERMEREVLEIRKQEELAMEQQRRQEDALRLLKEQHMKIRVKPWSQNAMPQASLADIQAQERERKLQHQRDQQTILAQMLAINQPVDPPKEKLKANLNLTWASQAPKIDQVKSLAEIQAEEQNQLAKQIEKDRIERQQQPREMNVNTGIWGTGSGLTWTNQNNAGPWGGVPQNSIPTAGFWDSVAPPNKNTIPNKQLSPVKIKPQGTNGTKKTVATNSAKSGKPKPKREEAAVLKLFETQDDEFSSWCSDTLHSIDAGIDVPTFSSFLRDVESPSDVKEYVKTYLGDQREANEFAKNFLERRSRMRAASRAAQYEDDMCAPAAAINPAAGQDLQDSSKKGKKAKKNKMVKVDTRILGFNVTAAQNRINVGERDTWEPDS